jgi:hypothetical protein
MAAIASTAVRDEISESVCSKGMTAYKHLCIQMDWDSSYPFPKPQLLLSISQMTLDEDELTLGTRVSVGFTWAQLL